MSRRKKNNEQKEHFASLPRALMDTDAWRALPTVSQSLYPWLKLEWHGTKFNNNGKIQLSVRQAAFKMGVSPNTAASAFHELQAKGFIALTKHASLGLGGSAESPSYELTEIALPHSQPNTGRRLFKDWRKGADFPVQKARANNPSGKRGKKKTCRNFEDGNVSILETVRQKASQK